MFSTAQSFYWWLYFQDPLTAAYKEKWRWWSAVELARRFIVILFVLSYPRNSVSNFHTSMRPKGFPEHIVNNTMSKGLILRNDLLVY